jgi:hypothetical protein
MKEKKEKEELYLPKRVINNSNTRITTILIRTTRTTRTTRTAI